MTPIENASPARAPAPPVRKGSPPTASAALYLCTTPPAAETAHAWRLAQWGDTLTMRRKYVKQYVLFRKWDETKPENARTPAFLLISTWTQSTECAKTAKAPAPPAAALSQRSV